MSLYTHSVSTSSSRRTTLSPEYALLGLLTAKPAHGYELHQRLSTELGQIWHISLSQAYNILKRLEGSGYVTGADEEGSGAPARRVFTLTPAGRQHFAGWMAKPSSCSVHVIRLEFITRLYFAAPSGSAAVEELITRQTAAVQAGLECLQKTLVEIPADQVYNRLGLELRLQQLQSILAWLQTCRQVSRNKENPT